MKKIYCLVICCTIISIASKAQNSSTPELVFLSGHLRKMEDSTITTGTLIYEKMPHYDNIGKTHTTSDGKFSLSVIKDYTYNITIKKTGFKPFLQTIKIGKDTNIDFYIKEDLVDVIKLDNLIFARGSDKITEVSHEELDGVAKWMHKNSSIIIQLEGHTDFAGNPESNMRLSEARVLAVKEYLAKKGVKKKRILTKAFGGTRPLTTERSPEAHIKNRRVEVRVIKR